MVLFLFSNVSRTICMLLTWIADCPMFGWHDKGYVSCSGPKCYVHNLYTVNTVLNVHIKLNWDINICVCRFVHYVSKISVVSPKGRCYGPRGRLQSFPAAILPCQRAVARPINTNITITLLLRLNIAMSGQRSTPQLKREWLWEKQRKMWDI